MKKFNDESEVDALLTKVAVDCGLMGVEVATKGLRVWFEKKGLFDNGTLSRWEYEFIVSIIEREFRNQVEETLMRMLKGDEDAQDKSEISRQDRLHSPDIL